MGDEEKLYQIADLADLPREIMLFLINKSIVEKMNDIRNIDLEDIKEFKREYDREKEEGESGQEPWTYKVSGRLKYIIEWFISFEKAYSRRPGILDVTPESFQVMPEYTTTFSEMEEKRDSLRFSMDPDWRSRNVTNRRSYGSLGTSGTQAARRRNVKISIGDYPKFSGKAKDWVSFERKFRSTASSHGFDHVLQDEDFEPTDEVDWRQFQEDSAFIYDAFQNAWADSMNFYLVEQNKKEKNGRKVYMDAKNYFRGEAVKDAILTENMDDLVNTKLTYSTPNGAEGFNNKFNDIVNSLEQQGHVFDPKILKGIYLGNIKDKVYENIKDNAAATETSTLVDIQAQILRKYLSIHGREGQGFQHSTRSDLSIMHPHEQYIFT